MGAEVPEDDPLGSDSSDESDYDYEHEHEDPSSGNDADGSSIADTESDAETDEPEQGGKFWLYGVHVRHVLTSTGTLSFPPMPDTPASIIWCNCNGHMDGVDILEDNGIMVTNQQRKFWEKWVVRKICTEQHGHK